MQLPAVTERVSQRMNEYRALQELVSLYPSLPTLFAAVLRKKLRRPAPVTAHLAELTTDEAARIGDGLGMLIMTSPSAQVAVQEWVLQSEALREMEEQQPCFVPMVERMAELLLSADARGLGRKAAGADLRAAVVLGCDLGRYRHPAILCRR